MELDLALSAHRAVASMSVAEWLTLKAAISITTPLMCASILNFPLNLHPSPHWLLSLFVVCCGSTE
jgi:hypothetical protein